MGHAGDGKDVRGQTVPERGKKTLGGKAVGQVEGMVVGCGQALGQGGARQDADLGGSLRADGVHKSFKRLAALPVRKEKMIFPERVGPQQGLQKARIGDLAPENGAAFDKGIKSAPDGAGMVRHARLKQYPDLISMDTDPAQKRERFRGKDSASHGFAGNYSLGSKIACTEENVNFSLSWRIS